MSLFIKVNPMREIDFNTVKEIPSLKIRRVKEVRKKTKTGKERKAWTPKGPRKKATKHYSISVALLEKHKTYLEKKALELNVRPAEVIRRVLDVFCREIIVINDLENSFNIFCIQKEQEPLTINDQLPLDNQEQIT